MCKTEKNNNNLMQKRKFDLLRSVNLTKQGEMIADNLVTFKSCSA